jgi:Rrf2 family protein
MSFSLTRKTDYALVALSALAGSYHTDQNPMSARQIAEDYDLPPQLLMNALKELHRAGVLESRRGVGGGYLLSDAPESISLKRVIEALEGPVSVTLCSEDSSDSEEDDCNVCRLVPTCPITDPIQRFNSLLNRFLDELTIADLFQTQADHAIPIGVRV